MLGYLCESLEQIFKKSQLYIATSEEIENDKIRVFAKKKADLHVRHRHKSR